MTSQPSPRNDDTGQEIESLQAEIEDLTRQLEQTVAETKRLMAAEDPGAGIFFAQEIFKAQQDKLRLEVEIELRRKKINRIRLTQEDGPGLF